MKWNKAIILIISLIATSIVIFNNIIQLSEKLFLPDAKKGMILSFLVIMTTVFIYTLINIREFWKS